MWNKNQKSIVAGDAALSNLCVLPYQTEVRFPPSQFCQLEKHILSTKHETTPGHRCINESHIAIAQNMVDF